jgi:hypothetical protein
MALFDPPISCSPMLQSLDNNLWSATYHFTTLGIPVSTRMTVVRLASGGLWLHSPIPLDRALRDELDALGPVAFIVAPSKTHYLFVEACAAAFPTARAYGAPGLRSKRPGLRFLCDLPEGAAAPWGSQLEHVVFGGIPFANETVWFHGPSATLIITDLVQWWQGEQPWQARAYASLTSVRRRLAVPRTVRSLVRDRVAARASAELLLRWDFKRVVMAHNSVVAVGARADMQRALACFG